MIVDVSQILAMALVAIVGLILGVFIGRMLFGRSTEATTHSIDMISPQLLASVDLMRGAALIVDCGDNVLHATPTARTTGLVRGNRISSQPLLDLVRATRNADRQIATIIQITRNSRVIQEFAVRGAPISDALIFVIADDRSQHTRTEEIKRDFTANVSHELKTPVGAIQVLAEAIQQAANDPAMVKHFANRMMQAAQRLTELVQQIIELSRLQSDDPTSDALPVEVDELVTSALSTNQAASISRNIKMASTGEHGLQVLGDFEQLSSALSNLVQNAIVYSDAGAHVTLATRSSIFQGDEVVEISVADNGLGIAEEELERIFERFYRVDYARSRSSGGTGLGLSIVKHVMAAHGGTVNVWSKPGQGSTFTLRLPRFIDPQAQITAKDQEQQ